MLQLTGKISHLRLGLLTEGFNHPQSEPDVDELVKKAATQLATEKGAFLEDVSVPMHLDCKSYPSRLYLVRTSPLQDGRADCICNSTH